MLLEISVGILAPFLLFILYSYFGQLKMYFSLPPGPFPLPLIGNFHQLDQKRPHITFTDYTKLYGDIFSFSFGSERLIFVSGYEAIKEGLATKGFEYAGRILQDYVSDLMSRNGKGIGFVDYGAQVKFYRRLIHSAMKTHGVSGERNEQAVCNEGTRFSRRLAHKAHKPIDFKQEFSIANMNVISSVLFNKSYEPEDESFSKLRSTMDRNFECQANALALMFLPWLRYFPNKTMKTLEETVVERDVFLCETLSEHIRTFDVSNIRDVADTWIELSTQEKNGHISQDDIEITTWELLQGGNETLKITLVWFILYMLKWPENQQAIYQEIVQVVGKDNLPTIKDRERLHWTRACIQETLRLSSIATLTFHTAVEDTMIGKFRVPQGTSLMFNLFHLHHDHRYWEAPYDFRPGRWLENDGTFNSTKHRAYFPFGNGPRMCVGKNLADMELFVFVTTLVRNFRLTPTSDDLPGLDGSVGFVLEPDTFETNAVLRDDHLVEGLQ